MNFSENTQAILLLNAHFAKVVKGEFAPLTANLSDVLASWHDRKVTTKRIQALLERGHAMALALDSQGYALVSGGARGVDETAMLGALNAEGTAVGIMADSLLKAATSAKWRKHLMRGNLALISPFYPEISDDLGLHKSQTKAWLVQAEREHKVEKLSRPVRYQWSVQVNLEGIE